MNRSGALRLAGTMEEEIARAMRRIRSGRHPRPHYISCLIRDEEVCRIQARYGTLHEHRRSHRRYCFADVRVGSHRQDQVQEGGLHDNSKEDESYNYVDLPVGTQQDGIRHALWRLVEARYREAAEGLLRKKSHELTYLDQHRHLVAFEKRAAVVDTRWRKLQEVDEDLWRRYVERASRVPLSCPLIKNSSVELQVRNITRIFVGSEGSLQVQRAPYWSLECYLWLLSGRGDALPWTISHFVTDPRELPDSRGFHKEIRGKIALLSELAEAPAMRSYAGPVLLEPRAAGLLIHEALGHRLEGNRLLSSGEGQTFRDSIGQKILPPYLTLRDDPSLERYEGRSLVGHFRYDDEGVEAQNAVLVGKGKLKGFLTTRTGIARRHRSNGHARSNQHERPISRMAVTLLEADGGLPEGALKELFLEELRRQKLPFGIRIVDASGGETATDAYNFQAFLGEINLAARVFPDGREEWIRGVNFVGTPLNAVRGIIAAGSRHEVDNAWCGAESGYIPVSTISPALLVSHLELQSKVETPYTQYAYPMPWEE